MSSKYPNVKTIAVRVFTDKPVRKTPYQVKGVLMNQFSDEEIVPMLDGSYREQFLYPRVQVKILNEQIYIVGINEGVDPIKSIAKKINELGGGLLTIDYGFISKKNQNTLQSVKKHRYTNPLIKPGHSDITSHINFQLFYEILKKNKLNVKKITTQNEFLKKIGIIERANIMSKKMTFKEKASMFYRLKRLLDYKEMGGLFKVLFAQKKGGKFSLGF